MRPGSRGTAAAAPRYGAGSLARDDTAARRIVTELTAACVRGSYLVIPRPASDIDAQATAQATAQETAQATRRLNQSLPEPATPRDRAGVARLFESLDRVPPGPARVAQRRPDCGLQSARPGALWAGVAPGPDTPDGGRAGPGGDVIPA